jgi:hypothetical protein
MTFLSGVCSPNGRHCNFVSPLKDQWKQSIVEDNAINGISLASAGNNIASYNGGYAHHIYMAGNSFAHIWGGDREVMTYDNAGGAYFGPLVSDGAKGTSSSITTLYDRIPLNRSAGKNSANGGGWVVVGGAVIVLNGTGAGQIRRVVANPGPREWVLDRPLDAVGLATPNPNPNTNLDLGTDANALDQPPARAPAPEPAPAPSFVQILPFRGRNIFEGNNFTDCGAFQFYGIGLENIVSKNRGERMAGMVNWGQWRGYHQTTPQPSPSLGGEMGCGANPNMRNSFVDNRFVEGNTVVNYNTLEGAFFGNTSQGYNLVTWKGGGAGFEDLHMNMYLDYRRNTVESDGGIWITDDAAGVLVENNVINNSDLGVRVDNCTQAVLARGNQEL